ncbi:MAG: AI-2E family transporter [Clostridia bacterium]|nr:AI-2E family transporter [Clostridia bacterium]
MPKFEWTKKHTTILLYTCGTILLAIPLVLAILFPGAVFGFIGDLFSAVSSVFFGFVIAYLLHPICNLYDIKVFKKLHNGAKPRKRLARALAVVCTMLSVLIVVALFIGMVVPQIKASYLDLESKLDTYINNTYAWITEMLADGALGTLSSVVNVQTVLDSLDTILDSAVGIITGVANGVVTFSSKIAIVVAQVIVSFIFACYFLIEKERLFSWISKFSDLVLPDSLNCSVRGWISYTDEVFGNFISGKIVNALIITVLNFILFGICGIPYYPLVALITGITDMIPYFGPFIGAIPSAFIILIADPVKVIWFAVLVLVVQQIDGNLVGPKILGEKVGVDSLLIIVAITVSGGMFGIVGMFVGVPIFTIIYHMVISFLDKRLKKKGLPTATSAYGKEAAK